MQAVSHSAAPQTPACAVLGNHLNARPSMSIGRVLRKVFNAAVMGHRRTPRAVACAPVLQGCVRHLQRQMDIALVHHGVRPAGLERPACDVLIDWADAPLASALSVDRLATHLSTIEAGYTACAGRLESAWLRGVENWAPGDQMHPDLRRAAACEVVRAAVAARSALTELQRADPTLR